MSVGVGSLALLLTALRFAFGQKIEAQNFHLTTKFDMKTETSLNHQAPPDAKRMLSVRASHSYGKWQAVKNSSWGEEHKKTFGDKEGFVICVKNSNREMVAIASVSGYFGQEQKEVIANAKLIEAAPALLDALEKFTVLDENHYRDIAGLIQYAKNVVEKLS